MSLQERTLVVKHFDPEKTTHNILKELCIQGGPIRNVVVKPDHAFIEYEDVESVGYSKALLDGIELFGKKLQFEPKSKSASHYRYTNLLHEYVRYDKRNKQIQQQQQQQQQLMQQQHLLQQPQLPYQPPGPFNISAPQFLPNPFISVDASHMLSCPPEQAQARVMYNQQPQDLNNSTNQLSRQSGQNQFKGRHRDGNLRRTQSDRRPDWNRKKR